MLGSAASWLLNPRLAELGLQTQPDLATEFARFVSEAVVWRTHVTPRPAPGTGADTGPGTVRLCAVRLESQWPRAGCGVHQLWKPFTTTFIYGSWKGKFTFLEPMITVAYLRTKPDTLISIPTPITAGGAGAFGEAGWYPSAYRIVYDAQAKEYHIGLTSLAWRQYDHRGLWCLSPGAAPSRRPARAAAW